MALKMKITKKQKNQVFVIQTLEKVQDVLPSKDSFDNTIYELDCKLIKGVLLSGQDNKYRVEEGGNFTWTLSKTLFEKILDEEIMGLSKIAVEMSVVGDRTAWLVSDYDKVGVSWGGVMATDVPNTTPDSTSQLRDNNVEYGYRNVKSRDDQRDLNIKWGMSLNNAVRVVTEFSKPNELILADPEKLKGQILEMTHKIMDVATSLDDWIAENKSDEGQIEQAIKDEDLPF